MNKNRPKRISELHAGDIIFVYEPKKSQVYTEVVTSCIISPLNFISYIKTNCAIYATNYKNTSGTHFVNINSNFVVFTNFKTLLCYVIQNTTGIKHIYYFTLNLKNDIQYHHCLASDLRLGIKNNKEVNFLNKLEQ